MLDRKVTQFNKGNFYEYCGYRVTVHFPVYWKIIMELRVAFLKRKNHTIMRINNNVSFGKAYEEKLLIICNSYDFLL